MSLRVITGPMFAGKTRELIRLVCREVYGKKTAAIFKPSLDLRYSAEQVVTHDGLRYRAYSVPADETGVQRIRDVTVDSGLRVVGIDEAQFFPLRLLPACEELVSGGRDVLVAGLNMDFRGEPFSTTRELLVRADNITFLTAVCVKCGGEATRSQRLIEGRPAPADSPTVVLGAHELYQPRCRACFEPPQS
jgi:thymidine kinase